MEMAMALAPCWLWTVICAATERSKYRQTNTSHDYHRHPESHILLIDPLCPYSFLSFSTFDTYAVRDQQDY